jgi:streptogramin lyase
MGIGRRATALLLVAVVAVASVGAYEVFFSAGQAACPTVQSGAPLKSQVASSTFGAVTEYGMPGKSRFPNAITVASDGSVWFAEQNIPGVAHLFPSNGTLVEYAWPGYPRVSPPDCVRPVVVSGIAIWNGRVWGADEFGSAVVGVNPKDGSSVSVNTTISINTTVRGDYPYWLAVGPDGALWYTSDDSPATLGRIQPDMSVSVVSLNGMGEDVPLQLEFVNSSLAYIDAINQSENQTTHACVCTGDVFAFDPSNVGPVISPVRVGGGHILLLPTSVSYSEGSLWVAQHVAASVVRYDLSTMAWTTYPTSLVSYEGTTIPLEIQSVGDRVWFSEHYANKIGLIDPAAGTLTEYSESNPPADNYTQIQNDEAIAATSGGVWFTSLTGNYVGFVDSSYDPRFTVSASGAAVATVAPGGDASFTVRVAGSWSQPMKVSVSDSENVQSTPQLIRIVPSTALIQPGASSFDLGVEVTVGQATKAGSYTLAVTVTNGEVQESAYLFVVVS